MNRFFYELLLPLTLMGSVATAILFLLQAAFSRMGKRFSGLSAWGAAAAFFLLPVALLLALAFEEWSVPTEVSVARVFHAVSGPPQMVADGALKLATLSPLAKILPVIPMLWLGGVVISAFLLALRLHRFSVEIKNRRKPLESQMRQALFQSVCEQQHLKKEIEVYQLTQIQSPFAYGLCHPAIYLPQTALPEWAEELAIRHEVLHIKQAHLWVKAMAEGIALLHWFNPMAYLLKQRIAVACEMDCDFLVTRDMSATDRKAYGVLLLRLAEPIKTDAVYALSQKGKLLSTRLLALRQSVPNKQQKALAILLAVLILLPCIPAATLCETTVQSTAKGAELLRSALTHSEDFLPAGESRTSAARDTVAAPEALIDLSWPVPDFRYCSRVQDSGISIVAAPQTEIVAAADGVVLATTDSNAEINPSYGQTVILVHGTSPDIATCYTHCETLYVQPGDTVYAGQVIATVGHSGDVSGTMCRYQVSIDGTLYNPARWYSDFSLGENFLL